MHSHATIAKVCHEVNAAYCRAIGDMSQPTWEDAPDWQKESAIRGVGLHLNNKPLTPEESHAEWMANKERDGWVHGEVKDPEKKTHPAMLPWAELPEAQRVKDFLFAQVIESFRTLR